MTDAYILAALRTPLGRRNGALKDWRPDDLGGFIIRELVDRNGVAPKEVEDVIFGCVTQIGEQGSNVARVASLLAGFGDHIPGVSVNRMCGSGQQAVNFAAQGVMSGFHDLLVAGGVESMTRVEMSSDAGPVSEKMTAQYEIVWQGESAERIADKWNLSRADLDAFALRSQQKALRAIDEGRFQKEIVPVPVKGPDGSETIFAIDEHPRRDTSLEKLGKLKTPFRENGKVTAGNASGINDGAAALLVGSKAKAQALGLAPRARIVNVAVSGVDPTMMLTGPIPSTQKVLAKAKLKWSDIDLFECNEAFASVPLAWMKETGIPEERLNVNGGAIALGHPLGASGARLLTTALHELERTRKNRALVTMCIGYGQGIATIIERV